MEIIFFAQRMHSTFSKTANKTDILIYIGKSKLANLPISCLFSVKNFNLQAFQHIFESVCDSFFQENMSKKLSHLISEQMQALKNTRQT